jgi:hypothetical protein
LANKTKKPPLFFREIGLLSFAFSCSSKNRKENASFKSEQASAVSDQQQKKEITSKAFAKSRK